MNVNSSSSYTGMFDSIAGSDCIIQDLHLRNSSVLGTFFVGGLVGGRINVTNSISQIINCSFWGQVEGTLSVGGLIGSNSSSDLGGVSIIGCTTKGTVTSSGNNVGGLVAELRANGTNIFFQNNYSLSDVSGAGWVGGLVGRTLSVSYLENNYSFGTVVGSGTNVGRFIGQSFSTSFLVNCYYNSSRPHQGITNSTGTARTESQMLSEDVSVFQGFDFDEVWKFRAKLPPALQWEPDPLIKVLKNNALYSIIQFPEPNLSPIENAIEEIKGLGFESSSHSLVEIKSSVEGIDVNVDLSQLESSLNDIKGLGFDSNQHSLVTLENGINDIDVTVDLTPIESSLSSIHDKIDDMMESTKRILGLGQENYRITDQVYNAQNKLLSATLHLFDSKQDTEEMESPIATYTMIAEYNSQGLLVDYRVVKED